MPLDDVGRTKPAGWVSSRAEMDWQKFVPDIHHIADDLVLLSDGSVLAMVEMTNYPFQLEEMGVRNSRRRQLDQLWKSIADNNVSMGIHLWHRQHEPAPIASTFQSVFYIESWPHGKNFASRGRVSTRATYGVSTPRSSFPRKPRRRC
jgi:hypothetical protein